jgi:Trehalose receptor
MQIVLIFGQIFGVFTYSPILSNDVEQIKLKLYNPKTLYAIFLQILHILEMLMILYLIFLEGVSFQNFNIFLSYFVGLFAVFYYLCNVDTWKNFVRQWCRYEEILINSPYSARNDNVTFSKKVKILGVCIIGYTSGE